MKLKSMWLLVIAMAVLGIGIGEQRAMAYTGCGGVSALVVNANYEQQVLDLVNSERANRSLLALMRGTSLDQAARYHATDIGQDNYFDHNSYDRIGGNLSQICTWDTRWKSYYGSSLQSLAENIAAGYATPQDVMTGWMNSPGHFANIVSTSNWEIGVGYATVNGSSYYSYWVQDFGRRSDVYPLIINRDAATTNSRAVSVYIYGAWQQMRLQNDSGAWGNWQPFQSNFAWTIGSGVGNHTVNAQLQNGGTITTTSDAIYLAVDGVMYPVYLPLIKR